jgi:uncharacterized protein (TIGR00106 family)
MLVNIEFSLTPLGVGLSLSKQIVRCEEIFTEEGVNMQIHAHGTNLEGEWDTIMRAIGRCHAVLHKDGVPRILSSIKIDSRVDRQQNMDERVRSIYSKMHKSA